MEVDRKNDLLLALRHPLRRDILREVRDMPGTSPKQISATLDEPLSSCGYHCRVLRDCGAIELVKQTPVRGAIQNHYRFAVDDPWALQLLEEGDREG